MRRLWLVVSLVFLLSAGAMWSMGARAQDATPAASPAAGPVGVTAQLLGSGQPSVAPGHELSLRRITLEPGGSIPAHTHPGALVIYVESGTWGHIALREGGQITRAAVNGTPGPTEEMPVGEEMILTAGDWIYVEDPGDDVWNAGDEPVVLWIAGLTRVGEPFTSIATDMAGMETGATPTP